MKNNRKNFGTRRPRRPLLLLLAFLLGLAVVMTGTAVAQEVGTADDSQPGIPHPDYPGVTIVDQTNVGNAIQTTVTIPVAQDAYISSGFADSNFGSSTSLNIGYNSNNNLQAMRILVQFDLASIPSNAHIDSASFNFYQFETIPSGDADHSFQAQYMQSSWNQSSVTWNNANYLGGAISGIGTVTNAIGWHTLNATNIIGSWHSGEYPNYGALLTGDERPETNRSRYWYSREQPSTCGGSCTPFLTVVWTQQCDTVAPVASVEPLPQWRPDEFTVFWNGSDSAPSGCEASGIANYDVEYRRNGGSWVRWKENSTQVSGTYRSDRNGDFVEFRARATDRAGNKQSWGNAQASTTLDTIAPTAFVNSLPQFSGPSGTITWAGNDNLSGIWRYDVQFRFNEGPWQWLAEQTTATSFNYSGAPAGFYEFRARAQDNATNTGSFPDQPQASTTVVDKPISDITVTPSIIKPTTAITETFTVNWNAFAVPGTTLTDVTLYYKFGNSDWIAFNSSSAAVGSTQFNWTEAAPPAGGDGVYYFTSVARDSGGEQETLGEPKATGIVDMADAIQPIAYMPLMFDESK